MARELDRGVLDESREATGKLSSSSISLHMDVSSASPAESEPRAATPTTWEKLSEVVIDPWLFTVHFNNSLKRGVDDLDSCCVRIAAYHSRDGSRFSGDMSKSDLFDYRFDFPFDSSACKVAAIVDGAIRERDCDIALIRLDATSTSLMAAMRAPAWSSIATDEDAKTGDAAAAKHAEARLSDMAMRVTLNTGKGKKFVLLRRVATPAGSPRRPSDREATIAKLRSKLASAKSELHALCATLKSMKVDNDDSDNDDIDGGDKDVVADSSKRRSGA